MIISGSKLSTLSFPGTVNNSITFKIINNYAFTAISLMRSDNTSVRDDHDDTVLLLLESWETSPLHDTETTSPDTFPRSSQFRVRRVKDWSSSSSLSAFVLTPSTSQVRFPSFSGLVKLQLRLGEKRRSFKEATRSSS